MVSISAREIMDPRNSERLICDVILDQLILPGVGNIIKNEALFDAGINPLTKVTHFFFLLLFNVHLLHILYKKM